MEEEIRSRSLVTAPPLVPELPPVPDWKPRIVEIKQIKGFWGHYDELVASGKYDPGSLERAFYGFLRTIFPSSEPSTRITFDDGTVLILLGGGPDSGALADQAAVILTVGGAAVSKATLKEALVAFFKGLGRETGESVADNVVQEVTGLPVGPSSLVPKKGKSRTPQSSRVPAPRFWTRTVTFQGLKVYQRSDLIDPKRLDRRGRSNLQRMRTGRAPIGPDGESLELHHFLQSADSPVAEVTQTFHQQRSRTMHINPQSIPSGIDRQSFRLWREQYWINRAKDFEGKS
ncbi:MAG: HNH/ENDO VII family nuclease [Pirellulales bacterium]